MRIRKSRLLMTFERLCQELENRPLRDIDICAFHTRLSDKAAYALSESRHGLFVVLADAEEVRRVKLITLHLVGEEKAYRAKVHVIHQNDIQTMAFITSFFIYEGIRPDDLSDLYRAFPDLDDYRQVVQIDAKELDLSGFLA